MKSVCEDLEMIATSDLFSEFRPCNLHKWVRHISDHPGPFLMAVKKIFSQLCQNKPTEALAPIEAPKWFCYQCGLICDSIQHLFRHAKDEHEYVCPFRVRVQGSVCIGCLKDFHSRERLVKHLKGRSSRCAGIVLKYRAPLPTEVFDEETARDAVGRRAMYVQCRRASAVDMPPMRLLHGPLLSPS